jgi:Zn-dependent protease with chaperone function
VVGAIDTPGQVTNEEVLAALPSRVPRVSTSFTYRVSLILVAGIMVLLPLLYIGLIGLVAWGVVWHYTETSWFGSAMQSARGKSAILVVIAYAAPGVIGGILMLFMVKPLFRRRASMGEGFVLQRGQQPLLFQFVDRLCDLLGAPRPVTIRIDDRVNASAGLASGWSMFSNKLVLTIGLPLAEGLTLRQLTGVLAHEFGHFSQFWAMRAYYIIETVNDWFRRVSTERDRWDMQLDSAAKSWDIRVGWVLHLARFFVWIVRKTLTGFRYVGLFFSRRLSRQMEFDADQYEIRIAGAADFAATFDRMTELSFGAELAQRASSQFLREGRALDNSSRFVVYQAAEIPPEQMRGILEAMHSAPVPWVSSHPGNSERIARASKSESAAFTLDCPASRLFGDFTSICREYTRQSYRKGDGSTVSLDELTSVDDLIVDQRARVERNRKASELFFNDDSLLNLWCSAGDKWPTEDSDASLLEQIRAAKARQEQHKTEAHKAATRIEEIDRFFDQLQIVRLCLINNGKFSASQYPLVPKTIRTTKDFDPVIKTLQDEVKNLNQKLEPFDQATRDRLVASLQLAVRRGSDDKLLKQWWDTNEVMRTGVEVAIDLERRVRQLEWLIEHIVTERTDLLIEMLEKVREATVNDLQRLYGHLGDVPYPFEQPRPVQHLAHGLISHMQDSKNAFLLCQDAAEFCSAFRSLRRRLQGHLAEVILTVDATLVNFTR